MKRIFSRALVMTATLALLGGGAVPAFAASQYGESLQSVPYVAAFDAAVGPSGFPHVGTMRLSIVDGAIAGTYTGMSVAPDRLNDRIVPVMGSVAQDGHVQMLIGNAISFEGTIDADQTIEGTAQYQGRLFDFVA
ncbi:MAG TPA: hypothetical protein VKB39_08740, partial [Candidatus Baltobacteraceae bacterium]|nr:hypothetical protein [Candidatus Baltobacteraceae bacterium]